jgi:hypothetical protein
MKTLAISLALACAAAQVETGPALFAGLLTHGIHRGDHAHAAALVADEGHLHLVLSHVEPAEPDHGGAPPHDHAPGSPDGADHVFHITGDDASNTTPRRADVRPAAAVTVALAAPHAFAPPWAPRTSPAPRAHGADPLRTVVLRL